MLSGKAVAKSSSPEVHNFVLSNIEQVSKKALLDWTKPDTKNPGGIKEVGRYFSVIEYGGTSYLAKITVKSYFDAKTEDKAYSIESLEVHSLGEAQAWVEKNVQQDVYVKPVASKQETTGGALTTEPVPTLEKTIPHVNPEVKELVEALFRLDNGSFSQASKGDFYPDLKLIARWKGADRSTLLHETGHIFLEARMQAYSELLKNGGPQAAGQRHFAENMQSVLKFLGVKNIEQWQAMSMDQRRKGHEKFARSFEAWLMLGKAPSENLQGVFAQFASWLKKLYICLKNIE